MKQPLIAPSLLLLSLGVSFTTAQMQTPAAAPPPSEATPTPATQPAASQPDGRAQASRAYFNQVSDVIDHTLTQPAAKAVPSFYSNAANKITTLSKENVDPDVVAWGGTVTLAFTNAANTLDVGKQRAEARSDSVAAPNPQGVNDPNGENQARVERLNAERARRQGGLEERANASEQVANLLSNLQQSRTKVAADLTARYGPGQP